MCAESEFILHYTISLNYDKLLKLLKQHKINGLKYLFIIWIHMIVMQYVKTS